MFLRISSAFLAIVLIAACGKPDNGTLAEVEKDAERDAAAEGLVECAVSESARFSRNCATEMVSGPDGSILVIRHPDGGFRRFAMLKDGRGLAAADGFDDTRVTVIGDGMIELTSGADRYRLPANVKKRQATQSVSGPDRQ